METKNQVLEKVEENIVVKTTGIDPKEFFKDREGLYVSSSFEERILEKAEKIDAAEFNLDSFKLLKYSDDADIEKELPEKHIFTESEVCAVISELISKQPKGEKGTLDNAGKWNLFYTTSCVVGVSWRSYGGRWDVYAWGRGGDEWRSGGRVFSLRNC